MTVRQALRSGLYLLVWVMLLAADMGLVTPGAPRLIVAVVATVVAAWLIVRRRENPGRLACYAVALSPLAPTCALGLFVYARHRRDRTLLALVGAAAVLRPLASRLGPDLAQSVVMTALETLVVVAVPTLFGAFWGQRDELAESLRARAVAAEADRESRAQQAVLAERARIAEEMHDHLGHKISLITLQAGALEAAPDAGRERVSAQAGAIGVTAREALGELRAVIGVLAAREAPLNPRRGFGDIADLVETSASAGARITLVDDTEDTDGGAPGPAVGRAAYRIVQEGLTNAHRHARGAAVTVTLRGGPEQGLEVRVDNLSSLQDSTPGAGTGLAGLRERVRLLGGTLHAAPTDDGFRVAAHLPWESDS